MKAWFLCLLLFTTKASGQLAGDQAVVDRLNADLMALKSLPALPQQAPSDMMSMGEQNVVMTRFANDVNRLYPKGFVTRNLAYVLTSVPAGRNLSDENLTPLTSAILGVIDSAFAWDSSSDLSNSVQFRAAIEQAYNALTALNVSVPNTQAVMRLLYDAARAKAHPLVQPIPPPIPPMYRPDR